MANITPLSSLLTVTGIGNGSIWAASASESAGSDDTFSAYSSPSASMSPLNLTQRQTRSYKDFDDISGGDEFPQSSLCSPASETPVLSRTCTDKEFDPGARSFVPGAAEHHK